MDNIAVRDSSKASGKASRVKIFLVVGVMVLLLLAAVGILVQKNAPPPAEQQSAVETFSQTIARPETPPEPLEAPPSSRDPQNHLMMPVMDEEPAKKPEPAPPPEPVAKAPVREEGPVGPPVAAPPGDTRPRPDEKKPGKKLSIKAMGSGPGGGMGGGLGGGMGASSSGHSFGSNFGSFGAQNQQDASKGGRAEGPLGGPGSARLEENPAARGAASGREARSGFRSTSGNKAANPSSFRQTQTFQKDPKGERQSDDGGVKPGWVQLDNGQYIHVIEMSGSVSEGSKDGEAAKHDQTSVLGNH